MSITLSACVIQQGRHATLISYVTVVQLSTTVFAAFQHRLKGILMSSALDCIWFEQRKACSDIKGKIIMLIFDLLELVLAASQSTIFRVQAWVKWSTKVLAFLWWQTKRKIIASSSAVFLSFSYNMNTAQIIFCISMYRILAHHITRDTILYVYLYPVPKFTAIKLFGFTFFLLTTQHGCVLVS